MATPVLSAFGSALSNARQAAADIALAVYERTQLTTGIDEPAAAGQLTRMSRDAALARLASRSIGRIAYVARAGVADLVPVNFRVVGETVYVMSGPGPKLQAADRRELVAFEVDDIDEQTCTGWSVVAHGTARRLAPDERRRIVDGGLAPQPWAVGPRNAVIAIEISRIAGRELH